jgi:hypothetical protein
VSSLTTQIRSAERRLASAVRRRYAAELVISLEHFRISLLSYHRAAGPGHVFTPDPVLDLDRWTTLAQPAMPRCRLCVASLGNDYSNRPCPGDIHICQADVEAGETPTAFQQYGYEPWLCGHRGSFTTDLRAWTCVAGHRTDRPHQRGCLGTLNASCPCRYLIVDRSPANGKV